MTEGQSDVVTLAALAMAGFFAFRMLRGATGPARGVGGFLGGAAGGGANIVNQGLGGLHDAVEHLNPFTASGPLFGGGPILPEVNL